MTNKDQKVLRTVCTDSGEQTARVKLFTELFTIALSVCAFFGEFGKAKTLNT